MTKVAIVRWDAEPGAVSDLGGSPLQEAFTVIESEHEPAAIGWSISTTKHDRFVEIIIEDVLTSAVTLIVVECPCAQENPSLEALLADIMIAEQAAADLTRLRI